MGNIFFKILIHNILLFKIKLTIRFTFLFSNYKVCDENPETCQIQTKDPSGEVQRPKWRRTKPPSGEG